VSSIKKLLLFIVTITSFLTNVFGQKDSLQLKIFDKDELTPARIEIRDKENNFYIADNAVPVGGDCDMSDTGAQLNNLEKVLAHFSKSVTNPYHGSAEFYTNGVSTLQIKPGLVYVSVFKGIEYKVFSDSIQIEPGVQTTLNVHLLRWINMPKKGWYSADDHLHIPRPVLELNPYISKMMQAEDIHVANLLQSGKVKNFEMAKQYEFGSNAIYREGDYILASGQENPRTHVLGHTITLGASKPLFESEKYLVYRLIWEKAVELGGINGYAHGWSDEAIAGHQVGQAIVLPHNVLHFMEILQINRIDYSGWYDVLNLGFKVAPTAGTDYPCHEQTIPGHERFYTFVPGEFNFENWKQGVSNGRTFVTTGPGINGMPVGSKIEMNPGENLHISGVVKFNPAADDLKYVEVVQNGHVIKKVSRTIDVDSVSFNFDWPVETVSWFALRGSSQKRMENVLVYPLHYSYKRSSSHFHTAPIYVNIQGSRNKEQPDVARSYLAKLIDLKDLLEPENIDFLSDRIEGPWDGVPKSILMSSRDALLVEIESSKKNFEKLIEDSK